MKLKYKGGAYCKKHDLHLMPHLEGECPICYGEWLATQPRKTYQEAMEEWNEKDSNPEPKPKAKFKRQKKSKFTRKRKI